MRLRILTAVVLATRLYAAQVPLVPSQPSAHSGRALTPELSAYAEQLLEDFGIHGASVGVVYRNKTTGSVETEFGTWGNRTEEGDAVQKDVRAPRGSVNSH